MLTSLERQLPSTSSRPVTQITPGIPAADGAGVRLTRFVGTAALPILDPFLLLDRMHSDQPQDYLAGFPNHPHRGFETVTYMLAGNMRHEDNKGHQGVIAPGGVQWMTAGRGIVHSEMPEQTDGLLWGFQLWLNLPAAQKMTAPKYQEFDASEIPEELRDGVTVRVIAGQTHQGTLGPIQPAATEVLYWDLILDAGQTFREPLPTGHNAFLVVYAGQVRIGGEEISTGKLAVLGAGDRLELGSETGGRALLIAGKPLNEPVAHGGPFVMNTRAEVLQAQRDFLAGRF
ncbi:MAG: pirin family protein [Cyanobacteria bacterium P01_G01_bin.54]